MMVHGPRLWATRRMTVAVTRGWAAHILAIWVRPATVGSGWVWCVVVVCAHVGSRADHCSVLNAQCLRRRAPQCRLFESVCDAVSWCYIIVCASNRLHVSAGPLEGVSGGARLCVTAHVAVLGCPCNPLREAAWRRREVLVLLCAPAMGCKCAGL